MNCCYWNTCKLVSTITYTRVPGLSVNAACVDVFLCVFSCLTDTSVVPRMSLTLSVFSVLTALKVVTATSVRMVSFVWKVIHWPSLANCEYCTSSPFTSEPVLCNIWHTCSSAHVVLCPVWAREHCRISPPRFLVECHKRPLNQDSLVLLCFVSFAFFLGCA